jgi:MinD superfamily P-loop ATPase
MIEAPAGAWHRSQWDFGPFVHSTLTAAQKNSDELVRILRKEARKAAVRQGQKYVIIDGPAGIGAPVIAAIVGVALAVVITEPTVSGIHDLRRVVELVHQLGIRMAGVINKHDLNTEVASSIEEYLSINGIPLAGKISFSTEVDRAIADGRFVIDIAMDRVAEEIRQTASHVLMLAGGEIQR